jgi:hypothetical protein
VLSATASKKGALRFGLAAPVVAGARFERATFGPRAAQRPIKEVSPTSILALGENLEMRGAL